jgi:hypothetical protein
MARWRVGVDSGGTFADVRLFDEEHRCAIALPLRRWWRGAEHRLACWCGAEIAG